VVRAVVLASGAQLGVCEFRQMAAHVEGFRAAIPPAPAPVDTRPVITGPAMLGAENLVPNTVEIEAPSGGKGTLGIQAVTDQGEIRSLEAMEADMIRLALGRYRGHMTEVARRLGIGRSTPYPHIPELGPQHPLN